MSDTLSVTCPSCSSRMRAPISAAGKKARCPKCQAPVAIPRPAPPAAEPDIEAAAAAALDDGRPAVADWRNPAPERRPEPPVDPRPVRPERRSRPTVARPESEPEPVPPARRRVPVPALVAAGVVVAGVGVWAWAAFTPDSPRGATRTTTLPATVTASPVSPAEQARASFQALYRRAETRVVALQPEALTPGHALDWDFASSLDTKFAGRLGPDVFVRMAYDVRETGSLVNPFKGTLTFGTKVTGRLDGAQKRDVQLSGSPFPTEVTNRYALDLDVRAAAVAEYLMTDGRWRLGEVRMTTNKLDARSLDPIQANLFGAMMASEMNKNPARFTGKTIRLDTAGPTQLVDALRAAAD